MSQHSLRSIRRKKLSNQTSYESWRELNHWAGELGNREAARRAGVPEATIRRWLKEQRIPKRGSSLERARAGIDRLRKWKKLPPPPPPPTQDQLQQREIVMWSFAVGVETIGYTKDLDVVTTQIVKGAEGHGTGLDYDKVRAAAWEAAQKETYEETSDWGVEREYKYAKDKTTEGRQFLSDAFIAGLRYLLDQHGGGMQVMDHVPEGADSRAAGTVTTYEQFKIMDAYRYAKDFPNGGIAVIVYLPFHIAGVYEITFWVIYGITE